MSSQRLPPTRLVVTLRRGDDGALGLGLDEACVVDELHPGKPAAACGELELGDRVVEVNGAAVVPSQGVGALLPADRAAPIVLTVLRPNYGVNPSASTNPRLSTVEVRADIPRKSVQDRERASTRELRANALELMVEPVRQSLCSARGAAALREALPLLLNMLLVLFASQTATKLTLQEHRTLRALLVAILEGVQEARRTQLGSSNSPYAEQHERLPERMRSLAVGAQTVGFKLRWPRLLSELTHTTPDVKAAFEATNFVPLAEAVGGLLEAVEEYGGIDVTRGWFDISIAWLTSTTDNTVRFKALAMVRLLLPRLGNDALTIGLTRHLLTAVLTGLSELHGAFDAEPKKAEVFAQVSAMFGEEGQQAKERARAASAGTALAARKPLGLALAEEALCTLHDIAKRLSAAGELTSQPPLLWACLGLAQAPYPTLQKLMYELLTLCLADDLVFEALRRGELPPPPPMGSHDGFASGVQSLLMGGLRSLGYWGPPPGGSGSGSGSNGAAASAGGRRHLLPPQLQPSVLEALRGASSVHAQQLEEAQLATGGAPPAELVEGLLDCMVVQLCAMHQLLSSPKPNLDAELMIFDQLRDAARAVDLLVGPAVSLMQERFADFLDGAYGAADASRLVRELSEPIFDAALPRHVPHLVATLHHLLSAAPASWCEPLMLLGAHALRRDAAKDYVNEFAEITKIAVAGGSGKGGGSGSSGSSAAAAAACTEVLVSAMQAAARAGDTVSKDIVIQGKAFMGAPPPPAPVEEVSMPAMLSSSMLLLQQVISALPKAM